MKRGLPDTLAAAFEGTQLSLHDQGFSQQEDKEPQIGGRVQQELQHWDLQQVAQLQGRQESMAVRGLLSLILADLWTAWLPCESVFQIHPLI